MAGNNLTGSHNYPSTCLACEHPDWVDDMVQCEECEGWYYFRCVGVTRSVELRYWACNDCLPISVHSQSSRASISKSLAQQRLEEEQRIHRERFRKVIALEKEQIEREKRLIAEEEEMEMTFLLEKFALLKEQEDEEEEEEEGSIASDRSRCRLSREKIIEWLRNDGSKEPQASTPNETEKAPNPEITVQSKHSHSRNLLSSRSAVNQTLQQLVALSSRTHYQPPTTRPAADQIVIPYVRPTPLPRTSTPASRTTSSSFCATSQRCIR